jgi:hypothetical protein
LPHTSGDHQTADKPITPKVVWDACQSAATRAKIHKRVSAHLLRNSYATHLLEAGADLRTIQLLLGHVKLEHTVIYLQLSQRHLQAVANPLDAMTMPDPTPPGGPGGSTSGEPATLRGGRHHPPTRTALHRHASRVADGATSACTPRDRTLPLRPPWVVIWIAVRVVAVAPSR